MSEWVGERVSGGANGKGGRELEGGIFKKKFPQRSFD